MKILQLIGLVFALLFGSLSLAACDGSSDEPEYGDSDRPAGGGGGRDDGARPAPH